MRRRGLFKLLSLIPIFGFGLPALALERAHENRNVSVKAGQPYYCANGHFMCEALDDIEVGETNWGHKIGNFREGISAPKTGGGFPICPECGSTVILWQRDGVANGGSIAEFRI